MFNIDSERLIYLMAVQFSQNYYRKLLRGKFFSHFLLFGIYKLRIIHTLFVCCVNILPHCLQLVYYHVQVCWHLQFLKIWRRGIRKSCFTSLTRSTQQFKHLRTLVSLGGAKPLTFIHTVGSINKKTFCFNQRTLG